MKRTRRAILLYGCDGLIGKSVLEQLSDLSQFDMILAVDYSGSLDSFSSSFDIIDCGISRINLDITDGSHLTLLYDFLTSQSLFDVVGVVNASYPKPGHWGKHFSKLSMQEFNESIAYNLGSYFAIANSTAQYFISRRIKGKHIGYSSVYGIMAPRFEVYEGTDMTMPIEYAASKSGIVGINRYFAKFYAKAGLTFNLIAPGGIFNEHSRPFVANYCRHTGDIGMLPPKSIADLTSFLLSESSRGINGQNIIIDDGFSL
jgi:NAD(P)-dependent dehydrogenase (short-subunit alcohol dehydrogenase family)